MIEAAVAIVALLWTIHQQYQINKICEKCPYFPPNNKKNKVSVSS